MTLQGNDISFSEISLFFFFFPTHHPLPAFPPTHLPELQLWPPGPILWINTLFTRQTPPITTDTLFWITTIWPKCSPFLSWRCPEDTTMLHRLIIQSRCRMFEKSRHTSISHETREDLGPRAEYHTWTWRCLPLVLKGMFLSIVLMTFCKCFKMYSIHSRLSRNVLFEEKKN